MVVTTSENGDPKRRAVNLEVDLYCRDWSLTLPPKIRRIVRRNDECRRLAGYREG